MMRRIRMGKFIYNTKPNQGFHLEFDNGYKISVQWGGMNYGSNRLKEYPTTEAVTAEIMITDSQGNNQEPIGWLTANEVAEKIQETASINVGAKWVFDFP